MIIVCSIINHAGFGLFSLKLSEKLRLLSIIEALLRAPENVWGVLGGNLLQWCLGALRGQLFASSWCREVPLIVAEISDGWSRSKIVCTITIYINIYITYCTMHAQKWDSVSCQHYWNMITLTTFLLNWHIMQMVFPSNATSSKSKRKCTRDRI